MFRKKVPVLVSMLIGIVVLCVALSGALAVYLHGQPSVQEVSLPVAVVEPYQWKNTYPNDGITQGDPGAHVYVYFQPRAFGITDETVPDCFMLRISLSPWYRQGWRIVTAQGYIGDRHEIAQKPRDKQDEPVGDRPVDMVQIAGDEKNAYDERRAYWDHRKPDQLCTLRLKLHHDGSGVSFVGLKRAMQIDCVETLRVRTAYWDEPTSVETQLRH